MNKAALKNLIKECLTEIYDRGASIDVSTLPQGVQSFLRTKVQYGCKDITAHESTEESPSSAGGQGVKAYYAVLDLNTGAVKEFKEGSWGGANMFNPTNVVDLDTKPRPISPGTIVIKGQTGYKPYIYATISYHPQDKDKIVGSVKMGNIDEMDSLEKYVLVTLTSYNSKGRKDEFQKASRDIGLKPEMLRQAVDNLMKLGMVEKAGTGVKVTSKGRNTSQQIGEYPDKLRKDIVV